MIKIKVTIFLVETEVSFLSVSQIFYIFHHNGGNIWKERINVYASVNSFLYRFRIDRMDYLTYQFKETTLCTSWKTLAFDVVFFLLHSHVTRQSGWNFLSVCMIFQSIPRGKMIESRFATRDHVFWNWMQLYGRHLIMQTLRASRLVPSIQPCFFIQPV